MRHRRQVAARGLGGSDVLLGGGVLFALELCLVVYCVLNVITTPEGEVRHLPKTLWLVLVLLFPLVGGIAWLAAGRPQRPAATTTGRGGSGVVPAEYDRPGRAVAASPEDDAAYLSSLKARADAQRTRAEQERRARIELEARREVAERQRPAPDTDDV